MNFNSACAWQAIIITLKSNSIPIEGLFKTLSKLNNSTYILIECEVF